MRSSRDSVEVPEIPRDPVGDGTPSAASRRMISRRECPPWAESSKIRRTMAASGSNTTSRAGPCASRGGAGSRRGALGLRDYRHTIETVNSQCEKMGLERLYARTNPGFELKVLASIIALSCTNMI